MTFRMRAASISAASDIVGRRVSRIEMPAEHNHFIFRMRALNL